MNAEGRLTQKPLKPFLPPEEPAGITRSTLKRTVLDSGLQQKLQMSAGPASRPACSATAGQSTTIIICECILSLKQVTKTLCHCMLHDRQQLERSDKLKKH